MVTPWLLVLQDIGSLERRGEELRLKCSRYFEHEFALYQPLPFCDHTGFADSVADEIGFVIGSQAASGNAILTTEQFVHEFGFQPFLQKRVLELSGGWRKYLGLALFANRRAEGKLVIDAVSQLADERLVSFLSVCQRMNVGKELVFCEYDLSLLSPLDPHFRFLNDEGDRLEPGVRSDSGSLEGSV